MARRFNVGECTGPVEDLKGRIGQCDTKEYNQVDQLTEVNIKQIAQIASLEQEILRLYRTLEQLR